MTLLAARMLCWLFCWCYLNPIYADFEKPFRSVPLPRRVWSVPHKGVAVTEVAHWHDASPSILVTTFNPSPGNTSTISLFADPANKFKSAPEPQVVSTGFNWPNQASGVILYGHKMVLAAGGMLVPGHGTGEVSLIKLSSGVKTQVSTTKLDYFYHQAILVDMNGDGQLDVLAARANVPTAKFWEKRHSELLWMEAPHWQEHILVHNGADVAIATTDAFSHDTHAPNKLDTIVAAQFFVEPGLAIYFCAAAGVQAWSNCSSHDVSKVMIDDSEGSFFNIRVTDLNGDGVNEILATNNRADGRGGVFVYEPPQVGDWRSGANWTKHVLARGYKPKTSWLPLPGQGAPGLAFPVHVLGGAKKPAIVVSTDDGGQVMQLLADSDDSADWRYSAVRITESPKGTIGTPSAADVDGDGWPELFVPKNAEGVLEMWTWAPADVASTIHV